MAAVTICSDFGAQKPRIMGTDPGKYRFLAQGLILTHSPEAPPPPHNSPSTPRNREEPGKSHLGYEQ